MRRRKRFVRVDVEFFHKSTFDRLTREHGPWAPLAFLSLLAAAKRSNVQGHVIVASEAEFWQTLGLYDQDIPFDMDALLTLTGQLKQTSRTPIGRLADITLTRFSEWQKDWRKEDDADRQNARREALSKRDNKRDTLQTQNVTDLDLDLPTEEGFERETVTTPKPEPPLWTCRHPDCHGHYTFNRPQDLQAHLEILHWTEEPETTALVEQGRPTEEER